jgi:hypothetical protein
LSIETLEPATKPSRDMEISRMVGMGKLQLHFNGTPSPEPGEGRVGALVQLDSQLSLDRTTLPQLGGGRSDLGDPYFCAFSIQ